MENIEKYKIEFLKIKKENLELKKENTLLKKEIKNINYQLSFERNKYKVISTMEKPMKLSLSDELKTAFQR